jgi:hypothetical protein
VTLVIGFAGSGRPSPIDAALMVPVLARTAVLGNHSRVRDGMVLAPNPLFRSCRTAESPLSLEPGAVRLTHRGKVIPPPPINNRQ